MLPSYCSLSSLHYSLLLCPAPLFCFFLKKKILIHFILYPLLFCPVILVLSLSCSNPLNPSLYCL
ncbi:expressed protein [Phakopsora pachyrhizi]|uniref:Expressed protein n=1 Tax=Phakopsora pachyrhizi TaxID=170000 RepID=A0AAV0BC02_PHAPC|nr:expressed protein [Phakopsora pachyrhizi]